MTNIMDAVRRDVISKLVQESLSQEERLSFFAAMTEVYILSNLARNKGLLALEDAGNSLPGDVPCIPFLHKAIELVVDGYEPEWIEEILTTVYWAEEKSRTEAAICYAYLRGLLMVQDGVNPRTIENVLMALVRYECSEEFEQFKEERLNELKQREEERNAYLYSKIKLVPRDEEVQILASQAEQLLLRMSDRAIQMLLRELDTYLLTDAMTCLSKGVHKKLFSNMSYRLQKMVVGDIVNKIHYVGETCQTDEGAAKKGLEKILYTIDLLQLNDFMIN